ncbi:hypothetical protein [Flavobacterium flavipallidum]|uniref:STAS domain-containing protein n=1 Tax=Flavobacterium flavipallidum TaxID=3139140 RepID=A0ABU9HM11_9FLAO
MAIEIKYNGGVYEIKGFLNSQNSDALTSHFETLMQHSKGVVITLNKVLDIDNYAVKKIVELYQRAMSSDRLFYIIGSENAKVNHQFEALNSGEILL